MIPERGRLLVERASSVKKIFFPVGETKILDGRAHRDLERALPVSDIFDDDAALDDGAYTCLNAARVAKPPRWIVQNVIKRGALVVLAGSPKVGRKTWLLMHLGLCVSRGQPFLGIPVVRLPVVYVTLEDGFERFAWRCKIIGVEDGEPTPIDEMSYTFRLGQAGFDRALEQIRKTPTLCIVDPLICATAARGLNENDSADMNTFLLDIRENLHESGSAMVLAHHFRKTNDRMRGSNAIEAGVDGWVESVPVKGKRDIIKLAWTLRDAESQEMGVRVDLSSDRAFFEPTDVPSGMNGKNGKSQDEIQPIDRVREVLGLHPEGLPQTEIGKQAGVGVRSVPDVLAVLQSNGEVMRDTTGKKWCPSHKLVDLLKRRADTASTN